MTHRKFIGSVLFAGLVLSAACKSDGGTGNKPVGAPTQLVTTATPTAPANTNVTTPIVVTVEDANGTPVPNQQVSFAVTAGGGTLTGTTTVTSDASGQVTAPTWKLGKSADTQTLQAALVGTSITKDITGAVQTSFNITVRFFGSRPISAAHQALFTAAAARLMAIVTGDVPNVTSNGDIDMRQCDTANVALKAVAPLTETIDDVVIYASSDTIDGPGKILGQAGPCYIRNPGTHSTIAGIMEFDKDDLNSLLTNGLAQDVITHEMLHVLGVGTLWTLNSVSPTVNLLQGGGTADPRYTGPEGRLGCVAVSGTITCATNVPVEGNSEPQGTRDSHWRERSPAVPGGNNFGNELMTGYLNTGVNPLSQLTLRSLTDLGYTVNAADYDNYTIPGGAFVEGGASIQLGNVERLVQPKFAVSPGGKVTRLPERK